mmetsp:Transcript_111033/g.347390  ORF Transcript_111033/g.347390 Transcript_111033/m.347390 type:complete len:232 (-) Transcript_111033:709-1404(-)
MLSSCAASPPFNVQCSFAAASGRQTSRAMLNNSRKDMLMLHLDSPCSASSIAPSSYTALTAAVPAISLPSSPCSAWPSSPIMPRSNDCVPKLSTFSSTGMSEFLLLIVREFRMPLKLESVLLLVVRMDLRSEPNRLVCTSPAAASWLASAGPPEGAAVFLIMSSRPCKPSIFSVPAESPVSGRASSGNMGSYDGIAFGTLLHSMSGCSRPTLSNSLSTSLTRTVTSRRARR